MAGKAKIKCVTYAGRIGWILRKNFSKYTSWLYLEMQYALRKNLFKKYVDTFNTKQKNGVGGVRLPCLISIETINRCNSTCSFCPANRTNDKRPFAKMEEPLFHKIIKELSDAGYDGYLNLYVNNEPFMDTRIEEWYQYAKENLPKAKMLLYTNGTLVTIERFKKIIPYIDKMIINNYSEDYKLHNNIEKIMELVQSEKKYWDKDITIQIRFIQEILTNRAGSAPNKMKIKESGKICIMPFTDFTIYPNGTVGLCCSDALEKTNLGNVYEKSILEIWNSEEYQKIRSLIGTNRDQYSFCKGCDFVDAGIRNGFIKTRLKNMYENNLEGNRC
ncbi:radical SAM/SPASM domain-containing protein [Lachnospiraceae bacterium 47-T17]